MARTRGDADLYLQMPPAKPELVQPPSPIHPLALPPREGILRLGLSVGAWKGFSSSTKKKKKPNLVDFVAVEMVLWFFFIYLFLSTGI